MKMDGNEPLTPKQRRFIGYLLAAPTVREAARQAGVSESTARRWLRRRAFREALQDAQATALAHTSGTLAQLTAEALRTLGDVLEDPQSPPTLRVAAARVVLDSALKFSQLSILAKQAAPVEIKLRWEDDDLSEGEAGGDL